MAYRYWWEYEKTDIPFEDWDVMARSDYYEDMELKRQERYDREHCYDDIYADVQEVEDYEY